MPNQYARLRSPFATVRTSVTTLRVNRRRFIYSTALAAGALATRLTPADAGVKLKSPNEKLDVGCIGVGGSKGGQDVAGMADLDDKGVPQQNIVALCDVDENNLKAMAKNLPGAKLYKDYREMLDKEKTLDAVSVTIPDHQHAPATMRAMALGRHVYCEKPLAHSVWEARQVMLAARKYGVDHANGQSGPFRGGQPPPLRNGLGGRDWRGAGSALLDGPPGELVAAGQDPPAGFGSGAGHTLDWDLWLGPAASRLFVKAWPEDPRIPVYCPYVWRGWWDFGCGAIGRHGLPHHGRPVLGLETGRSGLGGTGPVYQADAGNGALGVRH